ncbi:MAG: GNAT family N-acetyltransferase, partial [Verrucomicrobia bacterium]|nr:GNAT family N-acetyltransferase [Verrucomicrobiota bacterium]
MSEVPPVTVSYLEMFSSCQLVPKPWPDGMSIVVREVTTPQWRFNRFLYLTVGEQWNWRDKAELPDSYWAAYVRNPNVRTLVAYDEGSLVGYCELLSESGETEIAYFGLLPEFMGRGLGGPFLTEVLRIAWDAQPTPFRVWLHTCTDDHPAALHNYLARGMRQYRPIESCPKER